MGASNTYLYQTSVWLRATPTFFLCQAQSISHPALSVSHVHFALPNPTNWLYRMLFIINPIAANGAAERAWPAIESALNAAGVSYSVQFTARSGHATLIAESAIIKGHRQIVGVGGDGTNHEIINGIMLQQAVPTHEVRYTMLPIGTGNDWARTYGLASDFATRLRTWEHPQTRLQDIGVVDYISLEGQPARRYFANVAGMAYDGYVARRMTQDGKANNRLSYLLAVGRYLMAYTPNAARVTIPDIPTQEGDFYTINVGICKYSGGGMQLVPHAIPDDGLLAVTVARSMPRWEVLLQTPRFYNGSLLKHPKVSGYQTTQLQVEPLDPTQPCWLEADGELLGYAPATFSIVPNALRVVV
jgi:diacylglycerol kinase (ATP)